MRYSFISAAILAFTSSVCAQKDGFDQITAPVKDQNVPAGKPFTIVWVPEKVEGTVTIALLQGKTPETLQPGITIDSGVTNQDGSYKWNVPTDIPVHETYGFQITRDDDKSTPDVDESKEFQYSFPFHITGLAGSTTSGSQAGTTTVHLGPGSAYTASPSTTVSANSTTIVTTTSKNTSSIAATPKPSSNYTLATSVTIVRASPSTTGASSTGSVPAQQTTNAAMSNAVSGSLALIGGIVLAFAL